MKQNYVNTYGITENTILTDELVLSICLRENGTKINRSVIGEKYLKQCPILEEYLSNRYSDSDNVKETLYRMKNGINERPVCQFCGNRVHFISFTKGFNKHCSIACLNKDPKHKQKIKETCKIKYGVESPTCSEEVKQKIKNTCLQKYGVEYPIQNKEVRDKGKQTCLKKFGKERYGQFGTEEYKKLMQTKYGVDNPFQAEFVKEKTKQTNLQKYGVEYISQSKEIKEKVQQTCIDHYGVSSYMKTVEGQEKVKHTMLERYGVEYMMQDPEFKQELKQRNLQKYGVEYTSQIPEVKEKTKQTFLERYGVEHVLQNPIYNNKVQETKRKNKTFNTSKIEIEFGNYLKSKYTVRQQYKSELYPFNCDFYIEELDLYIELQGTWTHGRHRYNPEDPRDIEKLQLWKSKKTLFYEQAIYTWTIRDPLKFETAEKNNLKYLAIYSYKLQECINKFEEYLKTI